MKFPTETTSKEYAFCNQASSYRIQNKMLCWASQVTLRLFRWYWANEGNSAISNSKSNKTKGHEGQRNWSTTFFELILSNFIRLMRACGIFSSVDPSVPTTVVSGGSICTSTPSTSVHKYPTCTFSARSCWNPGLTWSRRPHQLADSICRTCRRTWIGRCHSRYGAYCT